MLKQHTELQIHKNIKVKTQVVCEKVQFLFRCIFVAPYTCIFILQIC